MSDYRIEKAPPLFAQAQPPKRFDVGKVRATLGQTAGRGMHRNSIAASDGIDRTSRWDEVLAALRRIGHAASDREIATALGKTDLNYARPRITELIDAGVLSEVGDVVCPVTGRTVRMVWVANEGSDSGRE
jgi:hypothetical protein